MVYEIDPSHLVNQLIQQLESLDCKGYILVHDDGSTKQWQDSLQVLQSKHAGLKLSLSSSNEGRAKARNKLMGLAKADYLLMIDGDAQLDASDFLSKYWQSRSKKGIVVGSKKLKETSPLPGCELRWKYTKVREIRSIEKRILKPQRSFQTNCFLIDLKHVNNLNFDENLMGYGHEDSLFGLEANSAGYHFSHIDNPTIYSADERSDRFLEKTDQALVNLRYIEVAYPQFCESFPLLRLKKRIKKLKLNAILKIILRFGRDAIVKNLVSNKPSLVLFDLYRIMRLLDFERFDKAN